MRPLMQSVVLSALVCILGCSRISSAELFKLQAECANQARQFEEGWRLKNGSDFQILTFQNHYNPARNGCFVHVYYGNAELNMDSVYDALQSPNRMPIIFAVHGSAKPTKDEQELDARIRDYMETK